ncbi:hypothetical protein C2S53_012027 [Perilla frutescens var. hirtella]|uniref:Uncharacterized protein n=1 Tax=Perilla frutescens var. hirtella TaxID=608512 RepID=A0AAD4JMI8_PERFH|nr:hypothetical protein C2S53_012027 [Perilla frutescens var. hirtella]
MISQSILVTIMMLLATGRYSEPMLMPACPTSCGNLTIPYPFGITSGCNLDVSFLITCNHSYNPPKPFLNLGSIEVLDISLDGRMKVASSVASDCYDESGSQINSTTSELTLSEFSISSTRNKFTAIGCDTYALVQGSEGWKKMSAGCVSWCDSIQRVRQGSCSGIGCCQTSIPDGVKDFLVNIQSFRNHSGVQSFNPCGYAFVVETDAFKFSSSDLKNLHSRKSVPVVLDWSVGNVSCREVQKNVSSFACRATNSECIDSITGVGYLCRCLTGFEGNPYLVDGCHDIDECSVSEPCEGTCKNLIGSYSCSCPSGFKGDGKRDGLGCYPEQLSTDGSTFFYIASVFMVPVVGGSWIIWRSRQKKVVKVRRNLFIRNGGELLEAMQSIQKTLSIFTAEDLKKATDNYDESKVICDGHHSGITYKGILPGVNRIVTINSCHAFDRCNVEVLISKLVTLSQINHRNVVKLLGCCIETQVPLVVYEFITVKTLSDYITDDCLARSLSWDIRLRIAADAAGALAYMHSASSLPIIHGSLNSSSILLHHGYTVKVHGFALRCSKCSCIQFYEGTLGYLDPDYFSSGQLTEKSDVYSFGFILAELLTGKNVMRPECLEGEEKVGKYFSGSGEGGELVEILDGRVVRGDNVGGLTEVGEIAKWCLSSSSQERPTMKEVSIALECVIIRDSRLSSRTRIRATRQLLLESSDERGF